MKAIIITKTNTLVEGKFRTINDYIISLEVPELQAYKASALIIEGANVTMYNDHAHIIIPRSAVQEFKLIDETN